MTEVHLLGQRLQELLLVVICGPLRHRLEKENVPNMNIPGFTSTMSLERDTSDTYFSMRRGLFPRGMKPLSFAPQVRWADREWNISHSRCGAT